MNRRAATALKLSPLLIPFGVIFSTGIVMAVLQSLGYLSPVAIGAAAGAGGGFAGNGAGGSAAAAGPGAGGWGGRFAAYRAVFASSWFYQDLGFSLYCAFTSAAAAVAAGTVLAYMVWRLPHRFQQVSILSKIPLILPHIAVAFVVLMFFSRTGYISSLTARLGITNSPSDFPPIVFGGSGGGIILAYIYKETPFAMLLVTAVLQRFDDRRIQTARMFGAGRMRVFFKVVLPHLVPVMNTTFIILFLYSFGAFDIPFIVGESRPSMLSIQVYNLYFKRDLTNRPQAMAVLVLMFLFSVVFIYLYTRVSERLDSSGRKI